MVLNLPKDGKEAHQSNKTYETQRTSVPWGNKSSAVAHLVKRFLGSALTINCHQHLSSRPDKKKSKTKRRAGLEHPMKSPRQQTQSISHRSPFVELFLPIWSIKTIPEKTVPTKMGCSLKTKVLKGFYLQSVVRGRHCQETTSVNQMASTLSNSSI